MLGVSGESKTSRKQCRKDRGDWKEAHMGWPAVCWSDELEFNPH